MELKKVEKRILAYIQSHKYITMDQIKSEHMGSKLRSEVMINRFKEHGLLNETGYGIYRWTGKYPED